jgi:hypothetical protein
MSSAGRLIGSVTWAVTWAALLLAAAQPARADDGVPNYNVKPECSFTQSVIPAPENQKECMKEEQAARTKLQQNWTKYPSADRAECAAESSTGGSPSYVDLLTCLEMTADARALQRKARSGQ